jgi:hypothetical protein
MDDAEKRGQLIRYLEDARDSRLHNYPPRWNAAPSQELLVIRYVPTCIHPLEHWGPRPI